MLKLRFSVIMQVVRIRSAHMTVLIRLIGCERMVRASLTGRVFVGVHSAAKLLHAVVSTVGAVSSLIGPAVPSRLLY